MSTTQQEKPYRLIPYFDVTCQCGARITSNKQINECSHCKSEIETVESDKMEEEK